MFGNNFTSYNQSVPSLDLTDPSFIGNQSQENQQHSEGHGSFNNLKSNSAEALFNQNTTNNEFAMNENHSIEQNNVAPGFNDDTKQASSVYTAFEDLPNYGENVNLDYIVDQMKILFEDKSNWKSKFDAIDSLRILNKYHAEKMNEIIDLFWPCIVESFDSQKTNIVKNIIMFSAEAFMNAREVRLQDEVIMALVPHVLNKSTSERSMIKKEAETALCNLISNCCYDSSVIILSKCCFEKNPAICEVSLYVLASMVGNIGDSLPMLRQESLQILMLSLAKIMDSAKKGNMKKWATEVCWGIDQRFGRENYQELVITYVANENMDLAQYLAKAVEEKKDVKTKDSGFHDFVQEKKKTLRLNTFDWAHSNNKMNNTIEEQRPILGDIQYGNQMNMQNSYSMGYGMNFQ